LTSEPLLDDRYVLVCREEHALAQHKRLAWRQLEAHTLILPGQSSGNRPILDQALLAHALKLRAFYEVQHSSTAVGMVAQGIGAAVVPELAVQRGAYPQLRTIALHDPVVSRALVLLTRAHAQLTPAAQALFDLLRAARGRQLDGAPGPSQPAKSQAIPRRRGEAGRSAAPAPRGNASV
jgi:DNA-binding transcriptional LysR family regulator